MPRSRFLNLVAGPLAVLLACGGDDSRAPTPDEGGSGGAGGADASEAGADAGAGTTGAAADCQLTGVWAVQQISVSIALGAAQFANTYFYLELAQDGVDFEVVKSVNCGTIVQGTATVTMPDAALESIMAPNDQTGRKGTMARDADGNCRFDLERYWGVRGLSEQDFLPAERNSEQSIADLQAQMPLPTPSMNAEAALDWDGDGIPGLPHNVAGPINGTRHSVQRNWNEWFSNDSYTITPAMEFRDDLVVAATVDSEESVMATEPADNPLLASVAPSDVMNENNRTKLRFLGADVSDPRALAIPIGATDPAGDPEGTLETCKAIHAAMPIEQARP